MHTTTAQTPQTPTAPDPGARLQPTPQLPHLLWAVAAFLGSMVGAAVGGVALGLLLRSEIAIASGAAVGSAIAGFGMLRLGLLGRMGWTLRDLGLHRARHSLLHLLWFVPASIIIALTATAGTASDALGGLFASGNGTWSFAPQLRLPLLDGGRARANVRVAEAGTQLALAQYDRTVQTAFREVADALAEHAQWAERLQAQSALVAATQKAFDLSEARFKAGVDNYLTVLDAQRSLYAAQQTQLTLRLAEQVNRITLYKVLGGG